MTDANASSDADRDRDTGLDGEDPQAAADRIVEALLFDAGFDGWTDATLTRATEAAGLPASTQLAVFPGGIRDAIAHFSAWADDQMLATLESMGDGFHDARVRDRITLAVKARFEVLAPSKEAMKRLATTFALPTYSPLAARLCAQTADAMWRAAGDQSTDFNYYSKRGLLVAVLGSTSLYWLSDQSEDHEATWGFLDRRIANVLSVGGRLGKLSKGLGPALEMPFRIAAGIRQRIVRDRG